MIFATANKHKLREMRELLLRLFATQLPPHDVHGRSTMPSMSSDH